MCDVCPCTPVASSSGPVVPALLIFAGVAAFGSAIMAVITDLLIAAAIAGGVVVVAAVPLLAWRVRQLTRSAAPRAVPVRTTAYVVRVIPGQPPQIAVPAPLAITAAPARPAAWPLPRGLTATHLRRPS